MRYRDLLGEADELDEKLAALRSRREALVQHWNTVIEPTTPAPRVIDAPTGSYKVHGEGGQEWWADPERGAFWEKQVYPLTREIAQLEAEITRQRRVTALTGKRQDVADFNTREILYHGTDAAFEVFDRAKARTAAHIYTSPDLETAQDYGRHVYAVYGRQRPQAVLTAEDMDYSLLRRVHRRGGFKRSWDLSFRELAEIISDAKLYSYDSRGQLQDDVIDVCLDLGCRSVRITDTKPGGSFSDSVIFGSPDDLQIVEKLS